jgi:hypothetical protein
VVAASSRAREAQHSRGESVPHVDVGGDGPAALARASSLRPASANVP